MEKEWNLVYFCDDAADQHDFSSLLGDAYHVIPVNSAEACLNTLASRTVHVLVMDEQVPGGDIGFLDTLLQRFPKTVIVMTGFSDNVDLVIRAVNTGGVYRYIPKPWKPDELGQLIKKALDRASGEHRVEDWKYIVEEMRFLHETSQRISEKKPLPELLHEIMESSKVLMHAEASSLLLFDSEDQKLHFQVATGDKGELVKTHSIRMGQGIAGWVAEHRQPLLLKDCYQDDRFNPDFDKRSHFHTRSMICVPMIRKGELLGVLQVINKQDGDVFRERDLTIFETLAGHCAIAIENARLVEAQVAAETLARELETAREIQQRLLPETLPEFHDLDLAAELIPAQQVGGDFYEILPVNENQTLFFVADVAGKSIPAALIVSNISSVLKSYFHLACDRFDLMQLVTSMNRVLIDATTITKFATAWFGLFDHQTRRLTSVNAGHNLPLIFRQEGGDPETLEKGGLFLGAFDGSYIQETVALHPGDALIFYTDGVTEAWNEQEEEYDDPRFIEVVGRNRHLSASEILDAVKADVSRHVGRAQQSDDYTCGVVKIL